MIVGYARTSTTDQQFGLDAQIEQLTAVGCEKIVTEQASSVGKRTEWSRLVEFVREGDILVVTKLDRLARSVRDFWNIADTLQRQKAQGVRPAVRVFVPLANASVCDGIRQAGIDKVPRSEQPGFGEPARSGMKQGVVQGHIAARHHFADPKIPVEPHGHVIGAAAEEEKFDRLGERSDRNTGRGKDGADDIGNAGVFHLPLKKARWV